MQYLNGNIRLLILCVCAVLIVCENLHEHNLRFYNWTNTNSKNYFQKITVDEMRLTMNTTFDPCENFYGYACGKWSVIGPNQELWLPYQDTFTRLENRKNYLLERIILEKVQENDLNFVKKLKLFYASCMDSEKRNVMNVSPLLEFLKQFGQPPAFDSEWSEKNFYWLNASAHARLYNAHLFFTQTVELDVSDGNRFATYISQVRPFIAVGSMEAYTTEIHRIVRLFGLETNIEFVIEMYKFTEELYKILTPIGQGDQNVARFKKMHLWTLIQAIPDIDWQSFLSVVQNRPVNVWEIVVVKDFDYLIKLGKLLISTNPRILSNYCYFQFVSYYMPLANSALIPEYNGQKFCLELTSNIMNPALAAVYSMQYITDEVREDVKSIFKVIREEAKEIIKTNSWIDDTSKNSIMEQLKAVSIHIGHPKPDEINSEYDGVEIDAEHFLNNFLNLMRLKNKQHQIKSTKEVDENNIYENALKVPGYTDYVNKNKIFLPIVLLQYPFYHRFAPIYTKYGFLGSYISHELLKKFYIPNISNENLATSWQSDSLNDMINQKQSCFMLQYNNYTIPDLTVKLNGSRTLNENLLDNDALRLAYRAFMKNTEAYQLAVSELTENPLFGMSTAQIFFLSFAQKNCYRSIEKVLIQQIETGTKPVNNFRVDGPLANFKQFAETYGCPIESALNPYNRCDYLFV